MVLRGVGPPAPEDCRTGDDVGQLYVDVEKGIWYECFYDSRTRVFTWAILPEGTDESP